MKRPRLSVFQIGLLVTFLMGALVLTSADGPHWTTNDKPYYADQAMVNFVRPGLKIQILSAGIANDGTITARVKFTDPAGLPLDKDGVTTPGKISNGSPGMVAAFIPKGATQYKAYTTRVQTSPITKVTAIQAGADSGGTWAKVADGEYNYTFKTKAPADFDKTATTTIASYGARTLTEFDMGTDLDDTTLNFVPDGSNVTQVRDVIRTETCNKCHSSMHFHGETGRKTVEVCVVCHQPQSVDPDTGNSVNLPVMIHKIHMGENLPSVKAGTPYTIVGNAQSVNDYSDIAFPSPVMSCQTCHESNRGATQADAWFKNPNRAACGACHDDVNFATGDKHVNLPQTSDNLCTTCHIPQGETDFDASIKGAHVIPQQSSLLTGLQYDITKVDDGVAGKAPTVTFTLKDSSGKPLDIKTQMARTALILAGPTTDYTAFGHGYVSEDPTQKATGGNGTYTYTFTQAIPADAKGTFSVGIEGRRVEVVLPGTKQERSIQYGAPNKVLYFSVDGSKVAPRRQIVAQEKCLNCHTRLALHGENRINNTEQCVLCHNPAETDAASRPANQNPPQTIDFRWMIHRIHGGAEVSASTGTDFIIYGHGGSKNDFSDVGYPGRLAQCDQCHVNGTQNPPLSRDHASVNNQRFMLNPTPPTSAACLACHQTVDAASHALANTTELGESCGACHSASAEFNVSKVHAADVR